MKFKGRNSDLDQIPIIIHEECLAKSHTEKSGGISVYEHCCATADVAHELLKCLPKNVKHLLSENPEVIVAVHDVGKVSPGFQKKLNMIQFSLHKDLFPLHIEFKTDHALISEAAVNAYLGERFQSAKIAEIVGIHHGSRKNRAPLNDLGGGMGGKEWAAERQKLITALTGKYGKLPKQTLSNAEQILLSGLVCVSD